MELGRGKVDRLSLDIRQVRMHSLFIQNNDTHTAHTDFVNII